MKSRHLLLVLGGVLAVAAVILATRPRHDGLVLTGIVTTDDVIVSSEIQGRLEKLTADQGATVKRGELLAEIAPQEWQADLTFAENAARGSAALVTQAEAELGYQKELTTNLIKQAEAALASAEAQARQADADSEFAGLNFKREEDLRRQGADSAQAFDQARTAQAGAQARADSQQKQVAAARTAVDLAKSNAGLVAMRLAALEADRRQLDAATAQQDKARVRLGHTEIRAPADGIVDVRAARPGEVVNPGQAIVTLIDPDNLWIRVDVEESYLERLRLGDKLTLRLPSGAERTGTIFFRGVDADYASQRDVSRTKRDIRTFEVRLRCDNRDRALAVGMTAYVVLPFANSTPPMLAVEVENLSKSFGTFCAVDRLNFSVDRGEVFGLLGPNGAGKSTLLRMLTTLVPPTSGTARINGFDIVRAANEVRKSIGVIPQAMTSDLDLSAQENMAIYAKLYGLPREKYRRVIRELLAALDLTAWADKPLKTFSGGMRRRLEIARGLVHEPKIFFLDEPTTGLDPNSRTAVWEMLTRLKSERDLTIIITTHYMDEADRLCDRVAIIDHGKLAALDSPLKLKATIPGQNILEASFSAVPAQWLETLRALPEVADVKAYDNVFRLSSHNGPRTTVGLITAAQQAGVTVASLSVQSTTLDDVFVHYTGYQMRDVPPISAPPGPPAPADGQLRAAP